MRKPGRRRGTWLSVAVETARLALGSIRSQPLRSSLAIVGVVIGIVTVVMVTSILSGLRNQVALLFREFGTDNIFAYHRSGDPYSRASLEEAQRKPLDPAFARDLARLGDNIREVGLQLIVPPVVNGRALVARGGGNESDSILVEGVSTNYFEVTSADIAHGRPFTDLEVRAAVPVAVIGSNVARALYGEGKSVGRSLILDGKEFFVVGEAAPRKGGFFGENRQDNIVAIPLPTARKLFSEADSVVFYIKAEPGRRDLARVEAEAILRRLRGLDPTEPNNFNLSTADQIIAQFDRLSAVIGLVTVALAGVSLLIGGIGIANVMIIAVTERTREIGIRRAIGAQRGEVLRQFLLESAILSGTGGALGVLIASILGLILSLAAPGFPAIPPLPVVLAGLLVSCLTGIIAGYGPARRAAALEPVEALRYE
jgi:putative ABC transport system permease protein